MQPVAAQSDIKYCRLAVASLVLYDDALKYTL